MTLCYRGVGNDAILDLTALSPGKFEVQQLEVSTEANAKADELYKKLEKLEHQIIGRLRAQASL